MINRIKQKFNKGFTIIETLVAILILTTAIAGPLTIAAKGLTTAIEARDQLTAFYLAQDAIEYVRYARDTNTLSGDDWLVGSGGSSAGINLTPCKGGTGCQLNSLGQSADAAPGDPSVIACVSTPCATLLYESANGNYDYAAAGTSVGTPSFVRTVKITDVTPGAEVTVLVTVSWHEPNLVRTITVQEDLFNWQ